MRLPYTVIIEGAANGIIARLGCETFVFSSIKTFMSELQNYLENPHKTVRAYQQTYPPEHELLQQPGHVMPLQGADYAQAVNRVASPAPDAPVPEGSF
jgi:hypothetical protein